MDENIEPQAELTTIDIFEQIDMRVGRVLTCDRFPEARKPSYKLTIDFGHLGIKQSSAQLTAHYSPEEIVGRLVIAIVNFPPRKIAGFPSQVLVLGVPGTGTKREGTVVLLSPEREVELGARIF